MPEEPKTQPEGAVEGKPEGEEGKSEEELAQLFESEDDSKLSDEQKAWKTKMLSTYKDKMTNLGVRGKSLEEKEKVVEQTLKDNQEWRETASKQGLEIKTKKEGLKILDQLIEQAAPADKETLRQTRSIIREETDREKTSQRLDALEKSLNQTLSVTQAQMSTKANDAIVGLAKNYGDKVIQKYERVLRDSIIQYPDLTVSQIFKNVVTDEDYEFAIATKLEKKRKTDTERKVQASTLSPEETTTRESVNVFDKKGVWDRTATLEKAVEEAKRSILEK